MNKIITINRTFGSGGREIGLRLADELGVPFYDKHMTVGNLCRERFGEAKKMTRLLWPLPRMGTEHLAVSGS